MFGPALGHLIKLLQEILQSASDLDTPFLVKLPAHGLWTCFKWIGFLSSCTLTTRSLWHPVVARPREALFWRKTRAQDVFGR